MNLVFVGDVYTPCCWIIFFLATLVIMDIIRDDASEVEEEELDLLGNCLHGDINGQ